MADLPPPAARCALRCFADSKDHNDGRLCHGETTQRHHNPGSTQPRDLKDQAEGEALIIHRGSAPFPARFRAVLSMRRPRTRYPFGRGMPARERCLLPARVGKSATTADMNAREIITYSEVSGLGNPASSALGRPRVIPPSTTEPDTARASTSSTTAASSSGEGGFAQASPACAALIHRRRLTTSARDAHIGCLIS